MKLVLDVDPVPAPRQVRSDTWNPRPGVSRYRTFRDQVWLLTTPHRDKIPMGGLTITFHIRMPESWSKKKIASMIYQPHQQKPDVDNLAKALLDSIWPDGDAQVWDIRIRKLWSTGGRIEIEWAQAAP